MSTSGRGRPRSQQARRAVLAASHELLGEVGYEGLSMEQVASRAGVGKQTVYRWWSSKAAVVAEAVLEGVIPVSLPQIADSGDLEADLSEWMRHVATVSSWGAGRALVQALSVAAASDHMAGAALYDGLTGPGQNILLERLESARLHNQLREDANLRSATEALLGFVLFNALARHAISPEGAAGMLDVLLRGLKKAHS